MTIEMSPPSTPPKAVASSAQGAKPTKAAAGDKKDAAPNGFMAVLDAAGEAASEDSGTAQATSGNATSPLAAAADAPSTAFDVTALLQQNPQIAAAQAAQAALRAAAASANPAAQTTVGDATVDNSIGAVGQGMTGTSLLPAGQSGDGVTQRGEGQPMDAAADAAQDRARPGAVSARAAATPPIDAKSPTDAGIAPGTDAAQPPAVHVKGSKDFANTKADSGTSANSPTTSVTPERPEPKDNKLLAAIESVRAASTNLVPAPVFAPLLPKQEKATAERAESAGKGGDAIHAASSLGVSAPDFSQPSVPVGTTALEVQVAEQVTYWVAQNVQNAELKLDGLGKDPVEVRISVQGNEAQITFRSDEAQTRGVLEGAGAHLKDMLQREGLMLTGMSVGTSGGRDASGSGGDRRGRQSARQTRIAPLESAAVPSARRPVLSAGRSVDLFV